ncbi:MAG: hypothetical protein LBS00_06095 [Synergistaceae bacterium]|nr:hypothetical protein [Synergistaceae bacterium]
MALLRDAWSQFLKYFWPSNLFMGFGFVITEWHRGNTKDKTLLLLIFTPMLVCMLGLVLSFASFVFAFVSRLLGWFFLTALFGGGGIFCYEKLRENRSSPFSSSFSSSSSSGQSPFSRDTAYDATAQDAPNASDGAKAREESSDRGSKWKRWFDGTRG